MMSIVNYALIAGLLVIQPVFAADNDVFSVCMDQAGGVTAAMIDCMGAETERQDVLLNKAYKELMGTLSTERQQQLQDAQRLWLKYRQANCAFYHDPEGGSLARVSANDCFMSATAVRVKELESFKSQQ